MFKDLTGRPLAVGDEVSIKCRVERLNDAGTVSVKPVDPPAGGPNAFWPLLTLDPAQVTTTGEAPATPATPTIVEPIAAPPAVPKAPAAAPAELTEDDKFEAEFAAMEAAEKSQTQAEPAE